MASLPPSLSSRLILTLALILISFSLAFSKPRRALDDHQNEQTKTGFKVTLTSVDSGGSFSKFERLQLAVKRSSQRHKKFSERILAAKYPQLKSTVYPADGAFFMNFSVGTPPNSYYGIMDTGSDLIWTQCQPCLECFSQPKPLFDPKNSCSFSNVSCSSDLCALDLPISSCTADNRCVYFYQYGDGSFTAGYLASETFTFENASVSKVVFGCGQFNLGSGFGYGLIGLGRGPLSLISQLGEPTFSYCLTNWTSKQASNLLIGTLPSVNSSNGFKTTPLIQNPEIDTFYYLSLEGISIGSTRLPINKTTFALNSDGSGGLIIDSGTTITYLAESAYILVRKEFISQVKLPVVITSNSLGLDLCFQLPSHPSDVEIPSLVFHFTYADLGFPKDNYMVMINSSIMCLAMADSGGTFSIFGNILQQNILVVYNLLQDTMSFMPMECDKF